MKNLMSKTNRQKIVCLNPCCYLCFCSVSDIGSNQNNNKKQKVAISLWILEIIENYDFSVHESKLGLNIVVNCQIINFHHIYVAVALNGNYLTQCNEYQIIYRFVFFPSSKQCFLRLIEDELFVYIIIRVGNVI